jgi:hypothetical protein
MIPMSLLFGSAGQRRQEMNRVILAWAMLTFTLWAQTDTKIETRIVQAKYLNTEALAPLIQAFGVDVKANSALRMLSLRGPAERVIAAEEAIKKLDVPPSPPPGTTSMRNIELHGALVLATGQGTDSLGGDLSSVEKGLRAAFSYRSYRLLETFVLRLRDGANGRIEGYIAPLEKSVPEGFRIAYDFGAGPVGTRPGTGANIIDVINLNLRLNIPYVVGGNQVQNRSLRLSTDVNLREGQRIVVGKSNLDGSDSALFLVLTGKVFE